MAATFNDKEMEIICATRVDLNLEPVTPTTLFPEEPKKKKIKWQTSAEPETLCVKLLSKSATLPQRQACYCYELSL